MQAEVLVVVPSSIMITIVRWNLQPSSAAAAGALLGEMHPRRIDGASDSLSATKTKWACSSSKRRPAANHAHP